MTIDGSYKCEANSPLGVIPMTLELTAQGDQLSGACLTPYGNKNFSGSINPANEIKFIAEVNSPLGKIRLEVEAKIEGTQIQGLVKTGRFGNASFRGSRVNSNGE